MGTTTGVPVSRPRGVFSNTARSRRVTGMLTARPVFCWRNLIPAPAPSLFYVQQAVGATAMHRRSKLTGVARTGAQASR